MSSFAHLTRRLPLTRHSLLAHTLGPSGMARRVPRSSLPRFLPSVLPSYSSAALWTSVARHSSLTSLTAPGSLSFTQPRAPLSTTSRPSFVSSATMTPRKVSLPRPYSTATSSITFSARQKSLPTLLRGSSPLWISPLKPARRSYKLGLRRFASSSSSGKEDPSNQKQVAKAKKSIWLRVKEEAIHYWHGFRLFGIEIRISSKYLWRMLKGDNLSRREHRQVGFPFLSLHVLFYCLLFLSLPSSPFPHVPR